MNASGKTHRSRDLNQVSSSENDNGSIQYEWGAKRHHVDSPQYRLLRTTVCSGVAAMHPEDQATLNVAATNTDGVHLQGRSLPD